MVLAPGPVFATVESVDPPRPIYLLSPAGRRLDQAVVEELCALDGFSLLCGRYEGVDQRVVDHLSTASSPSVTSCWPGVRPQRSSSSRPSSGFCPGSWVTRSRPVRRASAAGAPRISRSTPVRPLSGAGTSLRSSSPGTTAASPAGGGRWRSSRPSRSVPTCSKPGGPDR